MFHFSKLGEVKIVSMTTANPGWYLRMKEKAEDTGWWYMPVACWALCRFDAGSMMLPCVADDIGTLTPNDPDLNPCDLVYLPNARVEDNPVFGAIACKLVN
jgi:hypothetical protein